MKKLPRFLSALLLHFVISSPVVAEDLVDVYKMALKSDPILRAEQAAYDVATHRERQAKAQYLPNVKFSASRSETDLDNNITATSSDYSTTAYSFSLRQALYRRDYITQLNQAEANTHQAEAKLSSARQALIVRVAERYFDVLAAQDSLEFARAEKDAIERQLEQTKQRFEVGLIAITDVHESQAAFDLATASKIVAQNQLSVSQQALREVTGQLPQSLFPLENMLELISPEPADINQWVESALQQSFDIIAAEAAVDAAREGLNQRRSGRHPTLDFVASHDHSDSDGGLFGGQDTDNTTLSLQLNVPLYLGGSIGAGIREGRAELNQARQGLEQQRRATQRQVSDAYLSVLASISRVKALNQAVTSSEIALKATEAGYDVGTRTTVDVLNVRRELFRAQRDYARAHYDYILASLALKNAAGLLGDEDVTRINGWLRKLM